MQLLSNCVALTCECRVYAAVGVMSVIATQLLYNKCTCRVSLYVRAFIAVRCFGKGICEIIALAMVCDMGCGGCKARFLRTRTR